MLVCKGQGLCCHQKGMANCFGCFDIVVGIVGIGALSHSSWHCSDSLLGKEKNLALRKENCELPQVPCNGCRSNGMKKDQLD